MWGLAIAGLIGIQALLAFVYPSALIYVSLVIGVLPVSFGADGLMASAVGKMDLSAIRLLGLWLAACIVVLFHLAKTSKYLARFRLHFLFLIFCMAALFWSPSLSYGTRMFAKLSSPFLFLLLIMVLLKSRAQLKRMEALIVWTGVLFLAGAVAVRAAGIRVSVVGLTFPGIGPSLFAAFMVTLALLALASAKYEHKARNLALVVAFSAATLAAFTRITIAALFVGCSTILFVGGKGFYRLLLPAMGIISFPLLFLFDETFKERMFYGADQVTLGALLQNPAMVLEHLHTSGRSNAWSIVLHKFFYPSPLVGSGLGATQDFFYGQTGGSLGVIHSEYVRLASEVGILGLCLFALAGLAYLWRLHRIYRKAREQDTARYALAAIGAVVAYLIYIATDNGFDYVNGFGIYVFGLIGMAEKSAELQGARQTLSVATLA